MSDKFTYRSGLEILRAAPIGSGVATEIGDHLKISGGKVTPVTAATDNLTFYAKTVEAHYSTQGSGEITVAIRNANAIYEVDLDAATDITIGNNLQMNGAQDVKKSDTDPVAVAVESKLSATKIRLIYKLPATSGGLTFLGDSS